MKYSRLKRDIKLLSLNTTKQVIWAAHQMTAPYGTKERQCLGKSYKHSEPRDQQNRETWINDTGTKRLELSQVWSSKESLQCARIEQCSDSVEQNELNQDPETITNPVPPHRTLKMPRAIHQELSIRIGRRNRFSSVTCARRRTDSPTWPAHAEESILLGDLHA